MSQVNAGSGTVDYVNVFFQSDVVTTIAVSVICCFFTAHLIWLIERTQFGKSALLTNPKEGFNPKYLDGLRDGMWFASNTILNGIVSSEKTIITPLGKLITTVWTLFGILATAYITSILSSTLTTNNLSGSLITTAADAAGTVMCIESGFSNDFFSNAFPGIGVQKVLVPSVFDCYPLVTNGTVQTVFDVREQSITWFQSGYGTDLMISPVLSPQGYGIVMPEKWTNEEAIDEALLMWQTEYKVYTPAYTNSSNLWFSGNPADITWGSGSPPSTSKRYNWYLIGSAMAITGLYALSQGAVLLINFLRKRMQVFPLLGDLPGSPLSYGKGGDSCNDLSTKSVMLTRLGTALDFLTEGPDQHKFEEHSAVVGGGTMKSARSMTGAFSKAMNQDASMMATVSIKVGNSTDEHGRGGRMQREPLGATCEAMKNLNAELVDMKQQLAFLYLTLSTTTPCGDSSSSRSEASVLRQQQTFVQPQHAAPADSILLSGVSMTPILTINGMPVPVAKASYSKEDLSYGSGASGSVRRYSFQQVTMGPAESVAGADCLPHPVASAEDGALKIGPGHNSTMKYDVDEVLEL
ncbi:hypothetical protein CEUSTIGMA_g861.t1 [Chlamydomonas eustigma]|uniref:Ionotropic glutamate receptor C-terminal domain-containing protein n=1 Tax=Chlamydomonas eustigma TaxID=1157962 RepID=A0A250WRT2_9CHLO|nr:hypothetical protein CEUSTIGMA_g861.t1 [Chlamydomonas eustigma]|eukprot:GAX73409.1 hypothetical protein CEUSTIGMA_g861.t1 [Chlamydomonas eustigma]